MTLTLQKIAETFSNHPTGVYTFKPEAINPKADKPKRKPVQKPHPKLNRYKMPQALANLKEDVEIYQLTNMVVYYYKTREGYWRVHLHGYGDNGDKPVYYESEAMLGFDLLMTSESTYAGKIARQLAKDVGAEYQGINKSFEGWK